MRFILKHGDEVHWIPIFLGGGGPALVFVKKVAIKGTGKSTLNGKKICLLGDEKKVKVDVGYLTPQFPFPGKGTLMIKEVDGGTQKTKKSKSGGKVILKVGVKFQAVFKVKTKAFIIQPGPVPVIKQDGTGEYKGFGFFKSTNKKVTSS